MSKKTKIFALGCILCVFMVLCWTLIIGNLWVGIIVGGMSFASFLLGSTVTIREYYLQKISTGNF